MYTYIVIVSIVVVCVIVFEITELLAGGRRTSELPYLSPCCTCPIHTGGTV